MGLEIIEDLRDMAGRGARVSGDGSAGIVSPLALVESLQGVCIALQLYAVQGEYFEGYWRFAKGRARARGILLLNGMR